MNNNDSTKVTLIAKFKEFGMKITAPASPFIRFGAGLVLTAVAIWIVLDGIAKFV